MNKLFKTILKKIYLFNIVKKSYYFSLDAKKRIYNSLFPTARIIIYHRIAQVKEDPHFLSVSQENFYRHIKYLKENFNVISLKNLVKNLKEKKLKKNTIVLTFDDGYADNFSSALPVLEEFDVPATIFVTTGKLGQKTPYPWDKGVGSQDRGKPLSIEEIRKLSRHHLIEIGAHTVNHPKLAKEPDQIQKKEIQDSKSVLEDITGKIILSFAYPFGGEDSFNNKTISLVKDLGYAYACANIHVRVKQNSNIYALPRYVARNWNLEGFKKKVDNFT